ncbi:MAG: ATPase [Rickettsiales bacterium]|nr:MAG: ATPase [Rickettsiales bacterium]
MYKRTSTKLINDISQTFPVLLITGPRQVGKTTLLKMCADETRNYVTLDNMEARQLAQTDPALFLQTYKAPLIIDEVQYAPQLFSYIKILVDREEKNGMFWLTGSQKFHLMKNVSETLAGRIAILDLLGLSQSELNGYGDDAKPFMPTSEWLEQAKKVDTSNQLSDIYKNIWIGSFPRVVQNNDIRDVFYSSYVQTYIQRDIKNILNVTDETTFYRFLCSVAARTGQSVNYANLAKDVAIDVKTAKSWLSLLETSGLVYLLQPYHNNLTKRLVKAPKLYFLDTGLCCYLTKWPDAKSLEVGAMSGAILETYIIAELLKSYWHNGKTPHFYYYRDLDQKEIDLIIETGDSLHPVEFKKTATPSQTASKHFHMVGKFGKKIGHGGVVCFVEKPVPLSRAVTAIPVAYL